MHTAKHQAEPLPTLCEMTEQAGKMGHCSDSRCQQGCPHPYTYAARPQRLDASDNGARPCYLSDSLCGLLTYLQHEKVEPAGLEFLNLTGKQPQPVDARLYRIVNGRWQTEQPPHYDVKLF